MTTRTPYLVVALVAGGCLDVAEQPTPMCVTSDDCVTGETCDEGVCYGNPPGGRFALLASPPSERPELVSTELMDFEFPASGFFPDVQLEEAVTFKGMLAGCPAPLNCEGNSLAASIVVTGPAPFEGGAKFTASFEATAENGFLLRLPRTRDSELYSITVVPKGRDDDPGGNTTLAQLVPPMRFELPLPESLNNQIIMLDSAATARTVKGTIVSSAGVPVSQYRVVARGHWEAGAPFSEVSTVDYTGADGSFELRLASGLSGDVEVVATSFNTTLRPTLARDDVRSTENTDKLVLTLPDGLGQPRDYAVHVEGVDSSGGVGAVVGARVLVTGSIETRDTRATISASSTTNAEGVATELKLFDGEPFLEDYKITIVPPASATVGVVVAQPFVPEASLAPTRLPERLAIRGVVHDFNGEPVKDVSVTAKPSLRFLWNMPPELQELLSAIPPATTVTPESGEFVVFVDRAVNDVWGRYDLALEPSTTSMLPSFAELDIAVPMDEDMMSVALPDIRLPDPAYVQGRVLDGKAKPVAGAELKVFRLPENLASVCTLVDWAPATCPIPAQLLGRGASDASGTLRLTLPR